MWNKFKLPVNNDIFLIVMRIIQRASEASEADYQSCSIEISDIYIYVCIRTSKYFARASNYVS